MRLTRPLWIIQPSLRTCLLYLIYEVDWPSMYKSFNPPTYMPLLPMRWLMWRTIHRLSRRPSRWEMRREGRRGRRATTTRAWSSTFSPATLRATKYVALITRNLFWQNFFSLHICPILYTGVMNSDLEFSQPGNRCLLGSRSGTYRGKNS